MKKTIFSAIIVFALLGLGAGESTAGPSPVFTSTPSGTITVGDVTTITWSKGRGTYLNLFFSVDGGTTWIPIVRRIVPTSYNWTVPDGAVGTAVKLKIASPYGQSVSASFAVESNVAITIDSLTINGTAVTSGQVFTVADEASLEWSATGGITEFNVYYKIGPGSEVQINTDGPIADTTYSFDLLPEMVGKNLTLNVKDTDGTASTSDSSAFDVKGTITIDTQSFAIGDTMTVGGPNESISWTDVGITTFDVVYKIGAGPENAVTGCSGITTNFCSFAPAEGMVGLGVELKIRDADVDHPATEDISVPFDVTE